MPKINSMHGPRMPNLAENVLIVNQGTVRQATVIARMNTRVLIQWMNSVRRMERSVRFTDSIPSWLASPNGTCIAVCYMAPAHVTWIINRRRLAVNQYFKAYGILPDYLLRVDAIFLGWQNIFGGARMALYNVNKPGHPLDKSTVSAETLRANGLSFTEATQ